MIINKLKKYKNKKMFAEIIKFGIVGVLNTLIDLTVFIILNKYWGVYSVIAQVVSYSFGFVNSFILNKNWTFNNNSTTNRSELFRFLLINLLSLGITTITIFIFVEKLNLDAILSKMISILISMTCNFIGNKYWVFNKNI